MVCLLEPLKAIDKQGIVINLLNRCIPLQIVLAAAMVDPAGHGPLPIGISKVGLVLARTGAERIRCLDLRQPVRRPTMHLLRLFGLLLRGSTYG